MPPRDLFLASLKRCSENTEFIPAFYRRFLSGPERIRKMFEHTDFEQQHSKLRTSLQLCANATIGDPAALRELRDRATSHDRYHLNVTPDLYEFWLSAMIGTASEFDEYWDDNVEAAWKTILQHVINVMTRHY